MKYCYKCEKTKPLDTFYKNKLFKDGLQKICKDCVKAKGSRYNKAYDQACKKKLGARYTIYKRNAIKRNVIFNLASEDFEIFWKTQCSYCGMEVDGIGIDRVDNSLGYILENCVPCCRKCNVMKLNYPEEEWYQHMLLILRNQGVV